MILKRLLTLLFASLCFKSNSQILIGDREIATTNNPGHLSEEYMQELKSTTTLFVLQNSDYESLAAWDDAIKSVWTITPYKIIKPDELSQYDNGKYSYFTFGGFVI